MANESSTEDQNASDSEGSGKIKTPTIIFGSIILVLLLLFFYGRFTQSKLEKKVVAQQDTIQILTQELSKIHVEQKASYDSLQAILKLLQKRVDAAHQKVQQKKKAGKVPTGKPVKKK